MRLLKLSGDGDITLTSDLRRGDTPPYAILSHTWGPDEEEVAFEDVRNGRGKSKAGFRKIDFCARQAQKDGLKYFWVDTCCIDKTNLNELSESINSMFRWYREASKCYVFLADVSAQEHEYEVGSLQPAWETAFRRCRWLTRGWTLQELLAPAVVKFFSVQGTFLGDKRHLRGILEAMTGIPTVALDNNVPLSSFSVRDRMKWVASRQTTKPEDKIYCLLGIFAVFMSTLYGEGEENAFDRLKDAIRASYNNRLGEIGLSSIKGDPFARANLDTEFDVAFDSDHAEKGRYEDLLASLMFDQLDSRRANIRAACSTTCTWLLHNPAYVEWTDASRFEKHSGLMWIKGKPGAGKSTLVKFAHGHASSIRRSKRDEIIASFFFHARGDRLERSTVGMYRALLWQLLDDARDIRSVLANVPRSFKAGSSTWHIELLRELFTLAVRQLGKRTLRCFIDALDECDEEEVRDMILHLEDLGEMSNGHFSVCFASRHYPTIVIRYGVQLILENETGHNEDLTKYLQNNLRMNQGDFFKHILARALAKANGIFMWAVLVTPILNEEYRRGRSYAVEKRLDGIPERLSELFKDIICRDSANMDTLLLCVQWLLFAKTPLSREEFYFAMSAGSDHGACGPLEWDRAVVTADDMDRFIHDASKGLAEITSARSSSAKVQFIHESVRDFLVKDGGLSELWPGLGDDPASVSHDVLKRCCHNHLGVGKAVHTASSYPFFRYAIRWVFHHANEAAKGVAQDGFLSAFESSRWATLSNQLLSTGNDLGYTTHTQSATLLYLLACNNAPDLIRTAYRLGLPSHSPRERLFYPFFAAVTKRYWDAVRAILDPTGDQDLDHVIDSLEANPFTDVRDTPPLIWALEMAMRPLAECLVRSDTMRIRGVARTTALHMAAQRGYREVVRLLLARGTKVNARGASKKTALHLAAESGHATTFELLINRGADVEARCTGGTTVLHLAAMHGRSDVARTLIRQAVDLEVADSDGRTATSYAAEAGHGQLVLLLLDSGASVNRLECLGRSVLHWAVSSTDRVVIRSILSYGARIEATSNEGKTALWRAAELLNLKALKVLLLADADINARDRSGMTLLMWARRHEHDELADLLIEMGADVHAIDKQGLTAMDWERRQSKFNSSVAYE